MEGELRDALHNRTVRARFALDRIPLPGRRKAVRRQVYSVFVPSRGDDPRLCRFERRLASTIEQGARLVEGEA